MSRVGNLMMTMNERNGRPGRRYDDMAPAPTELEVAVSLLAALRDWIEDDCGAELPFTEEQQAQFGAIVPSSK